MSWMKLMRAALAALVAATMPLAAQAVSTAGDSAAAPLTAEQLTHYIAVKQALATYWPAHTALLQTARSTGHAPSIRFGMQQLQVGVFDYPSLVKQDTALAAIFTKSAFAPSQFEPTQVAAFTALLAVVMHEATGSALPDTSTVVGKNVVLVTAHRKELAAVGVALQVNGGMGMGGMGNGGGIEP